MEGRLPLTVGNKKGRTTHKQTTIPRNGGNNNSQNFGDLATSHNENKKGKTTMAPNVSIKTEMPIKIKNSST